MPKISLVNTEGSLWRHFTPLLKFHLQGEHITTTKALRPQNLNYPPPPTTTSSPPPPRPPTVVYTTVPWSSFHPPPLPIIPLISQLTANYLMNEDNDRSSSVVDDILGGTPNRRRPHVHTCKLYTHTVLWFI